MEVTVTPGVLEDHRHGVAYSALDLASIIVDRATSTSTAAAVRPFAATLLKVQTLHAAARQVAAACALIPGAGAQGGTTLRMRAGDLATNCLRLVGALAKFSHTQRAPALADSLLAAIEESSLLAHTSRLLLLMRPPPGAPAPPPVIAKQAELLFDYCTSLTQLSLPAQLLGRDAEVSVQIALGPCGQRAFLLLCPSVLAAADGQPCGLPVDPLLAAPSLKSSDYPRTSGAVLYTCLLELSLETESPAPSVSPRAILRLGLRALVLAGASARAGAGAVSLDSRRQTVVDLSWAGGRRRGTQAFRMLLRPGVDVLSLGRQALEILAAAAERWPRAWEAEAGRAWAPLLTAALHCLAAVPAEEERMLRALAQLLQSAGRPLTGPSDGGPPILAYHPAHLPPSVAAALEGGVVPLLETMLRCAVGSPAGPEAQVVRRFVTAPGFVFATLLAHSPPRQAASLLRTLAKLLRTLQPDVLVRPLHSQAAEELHEAIVMAALELVNFALPAAACEVAAAEPAAGALDPAAPCAPVCVLALAVLQLLPELSRLTLGAVKQLLPTLVTGEGGPGEGCDPKAVLLDESADMVVRATCVAPRDAEPGVAPPHRLASALCLPLLVEECGAVPLLGALLEASWGDEEQAHGVLAPRTDVFASTCLSVYAHYPHLVRGRGSGADGAGGSTAPGAAAAWSPEALRLLATRVSDTLTGVREQLEDLADRLEQPGSEQTVAGDPPHASALAAAAQRLAALRAEAAALLPACANPACASLEGDSEADVRLQQCGRCKRVSYCCRECQTAHWKAGHKAECGTEGG